MRGRGRRHISRWWRRYGVGSGPGIVRYTSTEACITTTTSPDDGPEVVAQTVGKATRGVELELVDDDGRVVAPGAVGHIRCRSAAVFMGYWKDEARTREVLSEDGWLSTGDLGFFDEDGNLRIVGRRSDMYIRGGYNVYPLQVEDVLLSNEAIDDVAIIGMPDPVLGEIGVAFVVPNAASNPDALRSGSFTSGASEFSRTTRPLTSCTSCRRSDATPLERSIGPSCQSWPGRFSTNPAKVEDVLQPE